MEQITTIIFDYMRTHRRLTVAGLGTFLSKGEGAPIIFSEFIKDDDGVLLSLLVERGMGEFAALEAIEAFVSDTYHRVGSGDGSCDLGELGVIHISSVPEHFKPIQPVAATPEPKPTIKSIYESAPESVSAPEPTSTPDMSVDAAPKKRKVDLVLIISILVGFFAVGVLLYSFIVSWMVGDITLPSAIDGVLERIFFGDYEAVIDTLNVVE